MTDASLTSLFSSRAKRGFASRVLTALAGLAGIALLAGLILQAGPSRLAGQLQTLGPLLPLLVAVKGVEVVESDPGSACVWVFADGAVEPESLVEALASWGYGAYVLGNQFDMPA